MLIVYRVGDATMIKPMSSAVGCGIEVVCGEVGVPERVH